MSRSQYNTKQKRLVIEYLKSHKGKHVSANDLLNHFKAAKMDIGQTTIYRTLDTLVKEHKVLKYELDRSIGACYEYLDEHPEDHHHFHLKCEECGELYHYDSKELDELSEHLKKEAGFDLDVLKTVLHGKCSKCNHE